MKRNVTHSKIEGLANPNKPAVSFNVKQPAWHEAEAVAIKVCCKAASGPKSVPYTVLQTVPKDLPKHQSAAAGSMEEEIYMQVVEESKWDVHLQGTQLDGYHPIQIGLSSERRGRDIFLSHGKQSHDIFNGEQVRRPSDA